MTDIMAFGAHPDDIEIFMGGALLSFKKKGLRTGICDLSGGEAGTYGSRALRLKEAAAAGKTMGTTVRETLDLPDSAITSTRENQLKLIKIIRKHRPEIVFSFVSRTRHPDHAAAGKLVEEASFLAGLRKIDTGQKPFRPSAMLRFPELRFSGRPHMVVDITPFYKKKIKAIKAYGSQVVSDKKKLNNKKHGKTLIRSPEFWEILEARCRMAGALIGVKYGEPFFSAQPVRLDNPLAAFKKELK